TVIFSPLPTTTKPVPRPERDYAEFCREYKQRYLYVCPDPFRFGQKAIVFCPLYAERCQVSLPDKPVVPTSAPPHRHSQSSTIARLCAQYRAFAATYCQNIFFLQQPRYRDACSKYWRFCAWQG
ncbi:unnamed protein product, partial [Toxocara canis]|uniref:Thyroglobulin type-1 domain-containing protein n=1 Tax=Toxocara canis TaxID=6265 RepID=A0A183U3N0_TOXCA